METMGVRSPHAGRDKRQPLSLGEYTYCDRCADENRLPKRTGKRKVAYCIGCDKYCNCIVASDAQLQIHRAQMTAVLDKERERR